MGFFGAAEEERRDTSGIEDLLRLHSEMSNESELANENCLQLSSYLEPMPIDPLLAFV